MHVLVDKEIKRFILDGDVQLDPFHEEQINPNSYDVTLGDHFLWYDDDVSLPIDLRDKNTIRFGMSELKQNYISISPKRFILGTTIEYIKLPPDIIASIEGKSSLARLGISLHQTGGWIDAGFEGNITLEFFNCNCRSVIIPSGMRIGQLVFYKTNRCEIPYNLKKGSKYVGQIGTTPSKY